MLKNHVIYLLILLSAFTFCVFYYEWFSWVLLLVIAAVPFVSLAFSLPFMLLTKKRGISLHCGETAEIGEKPPLFVKGKSGAPVPPALVMKIRVENLFSGEEEKLVFARGGRLSSHEAVPVSRACKHCGLIEIRAKNCRVYDLLGLFFIPIKNIEKKNILVLPKPREPETLPELSSLEVLGYKPSHRLSDLYELREFRSGDSRRMIHWKASSKYGRLIAREPSEPVMKEPALKPCFSEDSAENDEVIARLIYCSEYLLKMHASFFILCDDELFKIESKEELSLVLRYILGGEKPHGLLSTVRGIEIFNIFSSVREALV